MSDENNNQSGTNAQVQAGGEASQQPGDGIQRRIDELTAKLHQKDDTIQQLIQQQQAMLAEQLARQQANQPQQDADPFAAVLPADASDETKQMFAKMGSFFAKQLDEKLKGIQTQLAVQSAASEVQQVAQKFGVSDAVAQRTQELMADWRRRGLPFNAEDAVRFAAGEMALQRPDPRAGQVVPVFRAPNPVPQTRPAAEQPLPANFDDLTIEQQWELLHARVANKPL